MAVTVSSVSVWTSTATNSRLKSAAASFRSSSRDCAEGASSALFFRGRPAFFVVFSGSAFGFGAGFGFGFGDGFGGSDGVGVVVLVTVVLVFFGDMYLIAVLPYIACTLMIEGSSLDPDPAGLPATCTGGMETRRGGSFQDCAADRVDARIANNGPLPSQRGHSFSPANLPKACFSSRTSATLLNTVKLPSLDPKRMKILHKHKIENKIK